MEYWEIKMGNLADGTRDKDDQDLIWELLHLYPDILTQLENLKSTFLNYQLDTPCQNDKAFLQVCELIDFIENKTKEY